MKLTHFLLFCINISSSLIPRKSTPIQAQLNIYLPDESVANGVCSECLTLGFWLQYTKIMTGNFTINVVTLTYVAVQHHDSMMLALIDSSGALTRTPSKWGWLNKRHIPICLCSWEGPRCSLFKEIVILPSTYKLTPCYSTCRIIWYKTK